MGVLEDRELNDDKKKFYQSIGGSYVCAKCGQILNQEQYATSRSISMSLYISMAVCFIVFSILWALMKDSAGGIVAGLFMFVFLSLFFKFKKKKGCPICRSKKILLITSEEGKGIFKKFHPDYTNLIPTINSK
jgi:hypothetical protein